MRDRVVALVHGNEVATGVATAAFLGVVLTLAPAVDRALLLVSSVGLLVALGGLGVWLIRDHRDVEWTTSAGTPERVRGSDRRVTAIARSIDATLAGDRSAARDVQATVRSAAVAHLAQRGLSTDLADDATRVALGPELTAYLSSPQPPLVGDAQLSSFITTLEEH